MKINFEKATFKDFENIPGLNAYERAEVFYDFLQFMKDNGHMNYRFRTDSGCGPEMSIDVPGQTDLKRYISFVSNDYLGFTQHPKVKAAAVAGIEKYGTGSGASPLIGGHFDFHEALEEKIGKFFRKDKEHTVIYTTGYTANSSSLMSLLQSEDIAIVDMSVHASVFEGIRLTNVKMFLHNNLESLERVLKEAKDKYRTKMVIIDGIYSQDGDMAKLEDIAALTRQYGAFLMVDDAHGIGVIGKTGRGVIEKFDFFDKIDLLTGTFSKTFGNVGGYIIAGPKMVSFLKFQSRQQIFSATSTPAIAGIIAAIDLIDDEPQWKEKLWDNINYFKTGLLSLGMNIGNTESAIIPIKIGDPHKTGDAGRLLLKLGIYANPILYPAVAKKNARIRMSLMATHTKEQLDKTLNAIEYIDQKLKISVK